MKQRVHRIIAVVMALFMIVLPGECVWGTENTQADSMIKESDVRQDNADRSTCMVEEKYINPLYEDVFDESELKEAYSPVVALETEVEYADTIEEASEQIRQGMKQREEVITVYYEAPEYWDGLLKEIANGALVHTGNPVEGDYLKWQYGGWSAKGSLSKSEDGSMYYMTFTYTYTYYTSLEQETQVDKKINEVLNTLDVSGKSDYDKIKSAYDYVCEHTDYDYDNLENDDYKLKYTAYAALIDGKAVCQGYALLLYRMALELNIDCRLISGTGNGGAHGWNIIKIDGLYYNADATWDAGSDSYTYFLKGADHFGDHVRDDEYNSDDFNAAYPMSMEDYQASSVIDSGTCGPDIQWVLDNKGSLTISGTGKMDSGNGQTLFGNTELIQSAVIENGVTGIGDYAFYGCENLGKVEIADTVSTIGNRAFENCKSLVEINLPSGVSEIGTGTWKGCISLQKINIPESNLTYQSVDGVLFTADKKTLVVYPGGRAGEYVIPESVNVVNDMAFCGNANPVSLTISAGVLKIGAEAFSSVGDRISEIRFEGDVPEFGTNVFDETTTTIYYPAGNETWNSAIEELKKQWNSIVWISYLDQPEEPKILSVYSRVQTAAKVTWTEAAGAEGYELYRADSYDAPEESWVLTKTIQDAHVTQYTNQGLEIGKTYYYKVRAYVYDADGNKLYSGFSNISYMPATTVFNNIYSNADNRIRLLWNEVRGAHGYQIWRKNEDGSYNIVKTIGDRGNDLTENMGNVTAYSNTGLNAGQNYTYKIRAFAILDGNKVFGVYSDEYTVPVMPLVPNLSVKSLTSGRISLTWNSVNGAAGYQIWRADSEFGTYSIVKSITDKSILSYINKVSEGQVYYYKIRAYAEYDGKKTFGSFSPVIRVQAKG